MLNRSRESSSMMLPIEFPSRLHCLTILQRSLFIFSLIATFWIIFLSIYFCSRLIVRLIGKRKQIHSQFDVSSKKNVDLCRAFVISSNFYGSFGRTASIYRSDSFYSHVDHLVTRENRIELPIDYRRSVFSLEENKSSLIEHYLQTYDPLQIDEKRRNWNFHFVEQTQNNYQRLKETDSSKASSITLFNDQLSSCSTKLTTIN